MSNELLYEVSDGIAVITINRPESMNSFNRTMCNEFHDAWKRVREDNKVKAVVLRALPPAPGQTVRRGEPRSTTGRRG